MMYVMAVSVVVVALLWCLWNKKIRSWAIIGGIVMILLLFCLLRLTNDTNPERFCSKEYLTHLEGRGMTIAQVVEIENNKTDIEHFCETVFAFGYCLALFVVGALADLEDADKKLRSEIARRFAVCLSVVIGMVSSLYAGIKFPLVPLVNSEYCKKREVCL